MTSQADIVDELMALWAHGRQVLPFSKRPQGLSLAESYRVADGVRQRRMARGE